MTEENQLKSKLPEIDTTIKIITVSTSLLPRTQQNVKIKRTHVPEPDKHLFPIEVEGDSKGWSYDTHNVTMYEIVKPMVQGYLPSKVWWEFERGYVLMYYINKNVTAKPFQDQRTFCFSIGEAQDWVLSYDVRATVFIDQIRMTDGQMSYFYIFGENDYNMIVDGFLPFGVLSPLKEKTTERPQPKTPGTTRREKETAELTQFYKGEKNGQ